MEPEEPEHVTKEEVLELRRTIAQLKDKVREYEEVTPYLYADDMEEYLIVARTPVMDEKFQDAIKCSLEAYKRISEKNETMKKILSYFKGKTIKEKKKALCEYLKLHPCFRTEDPKLLLQRLKLKNKFGDYFETREIPLTPIKDAIDEFNEQEGEENLLK